MALPDFGVFANRLRKMDRHTGKWARRQGITCFRVYDADIPAFPLAVDRYEDYLHVAEYRRHHKLTQEEYQLWRAGCRQTMSEVLAVPMERIFFKERAPQKGKQQYEKKEERQHEIMVQEGGLQFIVNLTDYVDTGLFLDHRPLRGQVREEVAGRRFLNLFAYTGSFTVYAAGGGASSSLSIDLSNTYLDWARRNLQLNGFDAPAHRFLQADVTAWLSEPVRETFDLIVLDPPTFSNSKRMHDILDVQRDHPELINRCLQRLSPGGILYFSTNFRKFRLDADAIRGAADLRDISIQTVPKDFRNERIHYCWRIVARD